MNYLMVVDIAEIQNDIKGLSGDVKLSFKVFDIIKVDHEIEFHDYISIYDFMESNEDFKKLKETLPDTVKLTVVPATKEIIQRYEDDYAKSGLEQ